MNRSLLKSYAPEARRDFIQAVTDRAYFLGLTESEIEPIQESGDVAIIGGRPFPRKVASQRRKLEDRIRRDGFIQTMEAAAYTWFNRFAALRYMEIHGYLDHGYRVLSHPSGGPVPEILEHAADVKLPGLSKDEVIELKLDGTKDAELYRMLLVAQCNALHRSMPFLFEKIDDETELLLPDNLIHSDSLIRKLVDSIPEGDWEAVEVIGWLYQFYISEKKDEVIGKIVNSEDIPAATQLFTPNWIVKYMVQNSLGRQWLMTYPVSSLKGKMEYYIGPAEQTDEVQKQLDEITSKSLDPEEITLLDPACGSGHILVEAYDLFKEIYLERGYRSKDIPRLILEKNLFGLDIDDRAAQLACFALLMRAREDDSSILDPKDPPVTNVRAIQSSEGLDVEEISNALLRVKSTPITAPDDLFPETKEQPLLEAKENHSVTKEDIADLIELFRDGKTFGSLITVPDKVLVNIPPLISLLNRGLGSGDLVVASVAKDLKALVDQAQILGKKFHNVIANPPYMGGKGMNNRLKLFLRDNYLDVKSDLFSAFIMRNAMFTRPGGQLGFMSPFVWMFISSFEKLRNYLINHKTITSLVQLEYSGFDGATVPICTFTIQNSHHVHFNGAYIRLSDFKGAKIQGQKTLEAIHNPECNWFYRMSGFKLKMLPSMPIAYWVSDEIRNLYSNPLIGNTFVGKEGVGTRNDDVFMRMFWEVPISNISKNKRWILTDKAGDFRRWYMGFSYIMDWENDGERIKNYKNPDGSLRSRPQNTMYLFKEGVSWGKIGSGIPSFRWRPGGYGFNDAAPTLFGDNAFSCLSFVNSKLARHLLTIRGGTLNITTGVIEELPHLTAGASNQAVLKDLSNSAVTIGKNDWDSFETSYDFANPPLLGSKLRDRKLSDAYYGLLEQWQKKVCQLQQVEEQNNQYFIEFYGLNTDLSPDVKLEEITLKCNPHYRYGKNRSDEELEQLLKTDTIKELISYFIGCIMGRYSIDHHGIVYADKGNINFDSSKYTSMPADDDGIVPVMSEDWFDAAPATRFVEFIKVAWPPEYLDENLQFIAESLGAKKGESSTETIRRYLTSGFYKDHLQIYKKRPIYWLFSSGRQKAFECLVYLHRYSESTLSRMRNGYVMPLQGKYAAQAEYLEKEIETASSTSARNKLQRELDTLRKKQTELQAFDEELRHYADMRIALDLDDGVKVNYGKFGNLLAEVKTVTGKGK